MADNNAGKAKNDGDGRHNNVDKNNPPRLHGSHGTKGNEGKHYGG